jgi:hypothetical protein
MTDSNSETLLATLVGEGKKYKTVDDLARSRVEADSFIDRLKIENGALREAISTEANPDELIRRITEVVNAKTSGSVKEPAQATGNQPQSGTPSLSEEKVLELLNRRDAEQKSRANKAMYDAAVAKAFGDKQTELVTQRLGELGTSKEAFERIATESPQLALRALGINDHGQVAPGSLGASVNTEAFFGNRGGDVRNFAHYDALRKAQGMAFYSPETQKAMFEDRKRLGDAFWKA